MSTWHKDRSNSLEEARKRWYYNTAYIFHFAQKDIIKDLSDVFLIPDTLYSHNSQIYPYFQKKRSLANLIVFLHKEPMFNLSFIWVTPNDLLNNHPRTLFGLKVKIAIVILHNSSFTLWRFQQDSPICNILATVLCLFGISKIISSDSSISIAILFGAQSWRVRCVFPVKCLMQLCRIFFFFLL